MERARRELPMFPLGTVLFPHMVLPLHVFEPRYRAMMRDLIDDDGRFGVVLIERGHEVGGGDVRTDLGTVARIVEAEELEDGRWVVIAVGVSRVRVERWLPEEPYPRAEVVDLDDPQPGPDATDQLGAVAATLRRVLALQAELDEPAMPATTALAPDVAVAAYQAAVLAPLSPLDAQAVLAAPTIEDRLAVLQESLDELETVLRFRLGTTGEEEHDDGGR